VLVADDKDAAAPLGLCFLLLAGSLERDWRGPGLRSQGHSMLLQMPFSIAAWGAGWGAAPSKNLNPEGGSAAARRPAEPELVC